MPEVTSQLARPRPAGPPLADEATLVELGLVEPPPVPGPVPEPEAIPET